MKKSDRRIQIRYLQSESDVMRERGIQKRRHGVDIAEWRMVLVIRDR
jgi:hypothetical protein